METLIYYFTGTGNSLAVARGLCERLGDCRAVPIASLADEPGPVCPAAERVGIVYPVYFSGVPSLVAEVVAARLDLSGARYVFAACTMGGSGAAPSLRQLDRALQDGPGRRDLDAGFAVRMPGNYVLLYDRQGDRAIERTLADAGRKVAAIAEAVNRGEHTMPRFSPAGAAVHELFYPRFLAGVHRADETFTVDDRCTACGICAAVCPVGNVRLDEAGRPIWLHRCEQCMACIQLCPVQAIQAGAKTAARQRYHHPGVTVGDLANRGGE